MECHELYQTASKNSGGGIKRNLLFFYDAFLVFIRNLFFYRGFWARDRPNGLPG